MNSTEGPASATAEVAGGEDSDYLLEFSEFPTYLTTGVEAARISDQFVDVSIVCSNSGSVMGAHRVILSACSPYFHRLLSNPGLTSRHGGAVHPILMLQHDTITEQDLSDILAFVYTGRVNLPKARLPSFLAAAETLKIRGLVNSPKKESASNPKKKAEPLRVARNLTVEAGSSSSLVTTPTTAKTTAPSTITGSTGGGGKRTASESIRLSSSTSDGENDPQLSSDINCGATNKRAKRSVTATITPASASIAPPSSVAPSSVNKVNSNVDAGADPGTVGGSLVIKDEPIEGEDSSRQLPRDNTSPPTIGGNPPDPSAAPEHLVIPTDPALMRGLDPSSVEADSDQPGPSNSSNNPSSYVGRGGRGANLTNDMKIPIDPLSIIACGALKPKPTGNIRNLSNVSKTAAGGKAIPAPASVGTSGGNNSNLTVLFSEKGRCHFCRLLCPDVETLRKHLETVHQPPRHALCWNCENFFHICAIQRHRVKCRETYQSEKK